MRFPYKYPALIRGTPPRCRNVRNAVVWMEGNVDVPEFSSEDIPVACEIATLLYRKEWRYHDGQFFKPCYPRDNLGLPLNGGNLDVRRFSFSRTTNISQMMAFHLAARWHHHEPLLKEPIWPPVARPNIQHNEETLRSGWFDQESMESCALPDDMIHITELGYPYQEDVEFHEVRARRLAESVICIDGQLWRATDEPLRFMEPVSGMPFSLKDMSWIRASSGQSSYQPAPYGSQEYVLGTMGRSLGYWNWKAFCLPVTEHEKVLPIFSLMEREGSLERGAVPPRVEVIMPDVFGKDLPEPELVRVARGICAHMTALRNNGMKVAALNKVLEKVVYLSGGDNGVTDSAELETQLETLRGLVSVNMENIRPFDGYALNLKVDEMPARIDVLLESFANRPVEMPTVSARPISTGPAI